MHAFNYIPLTENDLNVREMPGFGPARFSFSHTYRKIIKDYV
jgi:hypothetical protein